MLVLLTVPAAAATAATPLKMAAVLPGAGVAALMVSPRYHLSVPTHCLPATEQLACRRCPALKPCP